jgi:peptidoglycan/LPS O-acetylase OafA/YrhL
MLAPFLAFAGIAFMAGLLAANVFSCACAVTSVWIVFVGQGGKLGDLLNWRWLQGLGTVSYSLYLVHNPVTGAFFRLARMITPGVPASAMLDGLIWIGSIIVCVLVATLLWALVERPSLWVAR